MKIRACAFIIYMMIICVSFAGDTFAEKQSEQDDYIEISEEDWEIIKDLEFLEILEVIEETDPELLKDYDIIKELEDNEGENEKKSKS